MNLQCGDLIKSGLFELITTGETQQLINTFNNNISLYDLIPKLPPVSAPDCVIKL